jgi:hypothetical protein
VARAREEMGEGTHATHSALDEVVVGATHSALEDVVGLTARATATEVGVGAGSSHASAEDDGEGEGSAAGAAEDDVGIDSAGWVDELGAMGEADDAGALRTLQRFSPRFLARPGAAAARRPASRTERSWAAVPARRRAAALSLWALARLAEEGPWPAADATEAVRRRADRRPAGTSIVEEGRVKWGRRERE